MEFKVTILGSNSALPSTKRNPSAQVVSLYDRLFLFDCGEGTQLRMRQEGIKLSRLNHIFITHLHGDHYFGLVGLLSTLHLYGRTTELHLYGNPALKPILDMQFEASQTDLSYPLVFHPIEPDYEGVLFEDKKLSVSCFKLNHRIPTHGFKVQEKPIPPKIRKEFVLKYDPEITAYADIKQGKDYITADGEVVPNHEICIAAARERSYAYCTDTAYDERILGHIHQVDMMYHEASFLADMEKDAASKYHATAGQAARMAKKAEARQLLIGHFSSRYKDLEPFLEEASAVFENTHLAEEGKTFYIEFRK